MRKEGAARVVVCRVGADRFALPVAAVREVVATPTVSRIPGAPLAVLGLANVRGTLVTAVSGPLLLGQSGRSPSEWLVVLTMLGGRVAIEVDEVEDLHTTESAGRLRTLDIDALVRPLFAAASTEA
jgi:purine-binding chemotaxis protein CheW